jgi:hypothetical protein
VSRVKGARLGGLLARGLIGGATAVIVVVATLLTWPWAGAGPSTDERRIADLQRLSHAIDAFRLRRHVLPASLSRLPLDAAAPIHVYDPVTNRPYDYRPLGPLAYELCASFDSIDPAERRLFWWHDAGRQCFALETREGPKPEPRSAPPAESPAQPGPQAAPPASEPAAPPGSDPAAAPGPEPALQPPAQPGVPPGADRRL